MKKNSKPPKPLGRPAGPITPAKVRVQTDALLKMLEDGDIDMKQYHKLKQEWLSKLTERT